MPGTHWSAALLTRTSTGAPTEAGSHLRGRLDPLNAVPLVAAGGLEHLRRRVDADDPGVRPAVREAEGSGPSPQPRSTTTAGSAAATLASRSAKGRPRKEPNRAYCCGSQAIRPSSLDADILTSRYLTTSRLRKVTSRRPPATRSTGSSSLGARTAGPRRRALQVLSRVLSWRVTSTWPGGGVRGAGTGAVGVRRPLRAAAVGPAVPALPRHLVSQTLVTSGTMTNRVDRLTARGLVERSPDPNDRRGVIALTDAGRETVDAALADLLSRERQLLSRLSERDRSTLPRCCGAAGAVRRLTGARGAYSGRLIRKQGPAHRGAEVTAYARGDQPRWRTRRSHSS